MQYSPIFNNNYNGRVGKPTTPSDGEAARSKIKDFRTALFNRRKNKMRLDDAQERSVLHFYELNYNVLYYSAV